VKINVGNKGNIMAACLSFSLFLEASATSSVTIYYGNLKRQKENLDRTLPPFIFLAQMVIKYPDCTTNIKTKKSIMQKSK
jgi:hypothetical protein